MKAVICIILLWMANTKAQTYVYRQMTGNTESKHIYTISRTNSGFVVKRTHERNGNVIDTEEISTDSAFSTLSWRYTEPKENTDLFAHRNGTAICVQGTHKGVKVLKTFSIDQRPWMQTFAFNFGGFLKASTPTSEFWALGAFKPGEIKIADFSATKQDRTRMEVAGHHRKAQRIKVSLAGLRSTLWHGTYFHDLDTGAYLRYEGVNGPPGTPPTTIELVAIH